MWLRRCGGLVLGALHPGAACKQADKTVGAMQGCTMKHTLILFSGGLVFAFELGLFWGLGFRFLGFCFATA